MDLTVSVCTMWSSKTINILHSQRLRLNAKVHSLLKACDTAFRTGDRVALREARINLTCSIKEAKSSYASRKKITSITMTHRGSGKAFNVSLPTGRKIASPIRKTLFYPTH